MKIFKNIHTGDLVVVEKEEMVTLNKATQEEVVVFVLADGRRWQEQQFLEHFIPVDAVERNWVDGEIL